MKRKVKKPLYGEAEGLLRKVQATFGEAGTVMEPVSNRLI